MDMQTGPIKSVDNRWLYTDNELWQLVRKMPAKRRANILEKAIEIMEKQNRPKSFAIASALGCRYEEVGSGPCWSKEIKIRA